MKESFFLLGNSLDKDHTSEIESACLLEAEIPRVWINLKPHGTQVTVLRHRGKELKMFRKRARRNQQRFMTALALAGSLLIAGLSLSHRLRNWIEPTAYAATYTVNTADDHDDGVCNVTDCSLREAINAANAGSGGDTISFNISGAGVHTINLTAGLPTLTKTVTIDGTLQPGFSGTPLIELNGAGAGPGAYGLAFPAAPNATVKGLIINRFGGYGISVDSFSGLVVQGCYIGTNATGTAAAPNGAGGIRVNVSGVTIGGTSATARNVISGNTGDGIDIVSGGATVQGNFIGTNAAGTAALPNSGSGILISGGSGTIGGTTPGAGNVISGNSFEGILLFNDLNGVNVQGNLIGTDVTGHVSLGTQRVGIFINTTSPGAAIIGGTTAAARNIISGNEDGFDLNTFSTGITIQGNYIGTDITGSAALPNTSRAMFVSTNSTVIGGVAAGAGNVISGNADGIEFGNSVTGNLVQGNFIGTAADGPVNTTINGTLNSTASTTFRIEFFSNTVCDPSGNGEGQVFLGSTNVITNGSCTANIGFVVPNASVSGQYITATATDANNNTSEFSACVQRTTTNAVIQFSTPNYNVGEGDGSVTITVNRSVDTSAFSSIDFATGNNE